MTGTPVPDTVEGQSLLPAIHDPSATVRETLHFAYRGVQRGVREGDFKLIEYVAGDERSTQLFDLGNDPHETANLADDPAQAGRLRSLRCELSRWKTELHDTQDMGRQFWNGY